MATGNCGEVSAGVDFAEERRQHELDVRPSRCGRPADPVLDIAADDAARRGIVDDDQVRMWNDRGSCVLAARVNDSVRPGWSRRPRCDGQARPGRRNVNALTSSG